MADATDGDSGEEEFLDCSGVSPACLFHRPEYSLYPVSAGNVVIEDLEELDINSELKARDKILSSALADDEAATSGSLSHSQSPQQTDTTSTTCDSVVTEPSSSSPSSPSSPKVCHIDHLPNEILLEIFSYFTVFELFAIITPVCTRWRRLGQDPTLRKRLVFSFERRVAGDRICELLAGSPHLLSLELQSREDGGDLLRQAATSCKKLRDITAKFSDGLNEDVLRALVENCPDVRHFNAEGSRISCSECYFAIAEFHNLRHLNLSHCQFLDNLGLVAIAKQCRQLEYLNIDGITKIYDYSVVCLTQEVGPSLKFLFLDGENLTDASYTSLAACKHLKMLGVSFCEQMTDVGLSGITGLCELTWMKLRKGVHLTSKGLQSFFSSGHLSNLTHLNLGECSSMNDDVLFAVAEKCPHLTNIVLHWCWDITDVGITALVSNCSRLRVLDLVGLIQLTGTSFINVPTALPDLLILDLEQCNTINDTILQRIVEEQPSLTVFDYWGDPVMPPNPVDSEGSENVG
ncbi:F-box/LRR-repeat protein 20 isoform X3 [Penaeus vannamei]|uniref:F-box/LRR-repeat protein 20 isoform X3 n=1 Tax=Penaeus vannamei TaxID=6689 RepID=UPI00387F7700